MEACNRNRNRNGTSGNATVVNNMLEEECRIELKENQSFLNSGTRTFTKMHVQFDDLTYEVFRKKGKRKILENVNGCFRPGRLTAILGPSGAGKTTLLRIISTLKSANVKGSITVNDREWNADTFRKQTCFLPQEFALLPLLTARETLYIAARLKVQGIRDRRAFNLIVEEIADNLNLSSCLDTMVENLSGGEKKRLSIGIEMVTRPSVLLLDEPTSGLDSTSSWQVLCKVVTAERGGDVDNLYEINRNNYRKRRTSFQCPAATNSDAADAPRIENTATKLKSPTWRELTVLLMRGMICNKRDNTLTKLRFIAHVVVAFLLGAVFYDTGNDAARVNSNIACVFFILLFLYFSSSMPAVLMFPIEAMVFLREYLNNWYRLRSYYTAKILSDLPLQLLCPSVFIFVTYYMTGQLIECNRFIRIWFICILTTVLGQSSGMLVGVAFHQQLGVFLIPAINMPIILFAGFFLKFSEMAGYLQPFCTISFFRYAFEGILQALYDGDRQKLPCSKSYCPLRIPDRILEAMDMPTVSFHTIILALCSWIICLQVATYLVLKWKAHVAQR